MVTDTFYVPITVPQDTFTFYIRAIDNAGCKDPTPDQVIVPYPQFAADSLVPDRFYPALLDGHIYNCFSYFSIGWSGSDPDNDATITHYYWYLADSSTSRRGTASPPA